MEGFYVKEVVFAEKCRAIAEEMAKNRDDHDKHVFKTYTKDQEQVLKNDHFQFKINNYDDQLSKIEKEQRV